MNEGPGWGDYLVVCLRLIERGQRPVSVVGEDCVVRGRRQVQGGAAQLRQVTGFRGRGPRLQRQ